MIHWRGVFGMAKKRLDILQGEDAGWLRSFSTGGLG